MYNLAMKTLLYTIVGIIASLHNSILTWNNGMENSFTDKELHFLVIGIVGILLIFAIHPIFKWLNETGHTMVITFLYVFTVMIVLAFAIEIGQHVTGTGAMEFADIVYGIAGFLILFVIFIILRAIYHVIIKTIRNHKNRRRY